MNLSQNTLELLKQFVDAKDAARKIGEQLEESLTADSEGLLGLMSDRGVSMYEHLHDKDSAKPVETFNYCREIADDAYMQLTAVGRSAVGRSAGDPTYHFHFCIDRRPCCILIVMTPEQWHSIKKLVAIPGALAKEAE